MLAQAAKPTGRLSIGGHKNMDTHIRVGNSCQSDTWRRQILLLLLVVFETFRMCRTKELWESERGQTEMVWACPEER